MLLTHDHLADCEITLHNVSAHRNDELMAIHHPSGTLLEGDMLFNLPPTEQYSRSYLPFWYRLIGNGSSMSPGGALHQRMMGGIVSDHACVFLSLHCRSPQLTASLARKELEPVFAAKFDRIVPCHGDLIDTGGRAMWDKVWGKYNAPEPQVVPQ